MTEAWTHNNARVEAEERKGYLYVRANGYVATPNDVERATLYLHDRMEAAGTRKMLLDLRALELPMPDEACHTAWQFVHAREYELLAFALPEEQADLMVTRMNMTGVSSGLPFRAFTSIVEAHRWLDQRNSGMIRRVSTTSFPAVAQASSIPPVGIQSATSLAPDELPSTNPPPPNKKRSTIPPGR